MAKMNSLVTCPVCFKPSRYKGHSIERNGWVFEHEKPSKRKVGLACVLPRLVVDFIRQLDIC